MPLSFYTFSTAGRKTPAILTCPVFFKAMQEVESHHDEGVQGNESYVHLKQESRAEPLLGERPNCAVSLNMCYGNILLG